MAGSMKWIAPSLALALAPLAGCASTPGYGAWVINDYCGAYISSQTGWTRTEAPANADSYRAAARTDHHTFDSVPENSSEYWFTRAGEIKLCYTNLQRSAGRRHWCNPRLAVWWVFRDTETGPVIENSQLPICVT